MPGNFDLPWLLASADDEDTRRRLQLISRQRQQVLERNVLPDDSGELALRLGGLELWLQAGAAFSALEIYQEIFRGRDHRLAPGFDGKGARTVLDIGANYGLYALMIHQQQPDCRLICAEPNPHVFPLLQKNIAVNRVSGATLVNRAVAARGGRMPFPLIRQIPGISGKGLREVPRSWMKEEFIETVDVDTVTLPELMAQTGVDSVDILKLDVEGMEAEVLRSSTEVLPRIGRIVVEWHSRELREQLASLLAAQGFDLVAEADPPGAHYYGDMYFVHRGLEKNA